MFSVIGLAFKAATWKTKLIAIAGILLLLAGIFASGYGMGYTKGNANSKVAIAKYEKQVVELQNKINTKQATSNEVITIKYLDRWHTIDKVVTVNHDVIHNVVPQQYFLSKGWVYAHNQAVLGLPIDPEKASDPTPSDASDRATLDVIAKNYGAGLQNIEQINGLLDWGHSLRTNAQEVNREKK